MNRLKPTQLKQMIWQGEGVKLDFKRTITSCDKIARTMASFANNKGGMLFIGVADSGQIIGVKSEDEEKYMIEKAATLHVKPMLEPIFEEVYVDDKLVLVVNIPESDLKPHYALADDQQWLVYVRIKDKSVLASKIVVDVLKRTYQKDTFAHFPEKEAQLLAYLATLKQASLTEISNLLKLSKRRTSKIVVTLILAGLVKAHPTEKEAFYLAS